MIDLNYQMRSFNNITTNQVEQHADPVATGVMNLDALCNMIAEDGGYLRGKASYVRSTAIALLEGIQKAMCEGKTVILDDYLRLRGSFTNLDPETRRPGKDTIYRVRATPLKNFQFRVENLFKLTCVESSVPAPAIVNVTICTLGGTKDVFLKGKDIRISGRNLYFDAKMGDTLTVSYEEEGETQSISLTPSEVDETCMRIPFPAALAEVPTGTVCTFTLTTRRGIENGVVFTEPRKATLADK